MKKIPLTRGKFAIVDDEDYPLLSRFRWSAHHSRGRFQATRSIVIYAPSGHVINRMKVPMQYWILPRPSRLGNRVAIIDHENRDSLDNRKDNLRWATQSENASNWWRQSKYGRGVSRQNRRFRAILELAGTKRRGGTFRTAQEARDAYDRLVDEFCPEFGMRNRDHWRENG